MLNRNSGGPKFVVLMEHKRIHTKNKIIRYYATAKYQTRFIIGITTNNNDKRKIFFCEGMNDNNNGAPV